MTQLPDFTARFFLGFSQAYTVLALLIIGYCFASKQTFYDAACVTLLAVITNVALKVTFQVPLSPTLHKVGFAFPSGHMQVSSALYLWLFLNINNKVARNIIFVLLAGIGWGLIHFDYHSFFDVLGGLFFALALIMLYWLIMQSKYRFQAHWIFFGYTSVLLAYIAYRYTVPVHVKYAYGILAVIVFLQAIRRHRLRPM